MNVIRGFKRSILRFEDLTLTKPHKGMICRSLEKVSGYSRQQLTRLIHQYRQTGYVMRRQRTVESFARQYREEDIRLLAAMDAPYESPVGPRLKSYVSGLGS